MSDDQNYAAQQAQSSAGNILSQQAQMQQNQLGAQQYHMSTSGISSGTLQGMGTISGGLTSSNYPWGQSAAGHIVYKQSPPKNSEMVTTLIYGKMYEHGIPVEHFDHIKKTIYATMMESQLDGYIGMSYTEFVLIECVKLLPTYKFKSDMTELLDSDTTKE